ncbi:UNVERIFIED_CONTAM: hypothetical protein Slati_0877500 [Sesamum latifolium]|uniref:Uncharacterized protein n=1 Tax=Sesamum latifolium TaxID=2727402 RepID=A0AAW2XMK9_9LAMI
MTNVHQAKGFLQTIQQLLEADHSNDLLLLLERMARLILLKAAQLEQSMLQQRAKIQCLKEGSVFEDLLSKDSSTKGITKDIPYYLRKW